MPNDMLPQASLAGSHAGPNGTAYKVLSGYKTRVLADEDNVTRVFFHETPVVSFNERSIALNTGGWWTRTTKARMNQASQEFGLGFRVLQKQNKWLVEYQGETHPIVSDELVLRRTDRTREGGE
jgi:hypothetical protein